MFTTSFFLIYLIIVILLYFLVRREWRVHLLSVSGILYCFYLDTYAGIVLILSSLFTYLAGHELAKFREKNKLTACKLLTGLSVFIHSFTIFFYKFVLYLWERMGLVSESPPSFLEFFVIPIGLSFYTFQAISYILDIYHQKYTPKESLSEFLLYMSFFPKFISGPIERPSEFFSQLKSLQNIIFWQTGRLSTSFTYILYGYFLKIVIADRVSVTVNRLFEYPQGYDSFWLSLGIILYTIQIYTDFAGYSYIAYGISGIFGIKLDPNFKTPYFALSISDFWRRWHISLSSWLRDYFYIPLGGNRKGKTRKSFNTLLVFLVCGLWHGTGLSFVIWGLLHGFYSIAETLFLHKIKNQIIKRSLTLVQVSVAWVFFRATSAGAAINYFKQTLLQGTSILRICKNFEKLDLNTVELWVILLSILIMFWADSYGYRNNSVFPKVLQNKSQLIRYCLFYLFLIIIFIFGIYGPGYHSENFIYMQF